MANRNAIEEISDDIDFNIDEIEESISKELEESFKELEILEIDRKKYLIQIH